MSADKENITTPSEDVIRVSGLVKSFGTHKVLQGVDLNLSKGENLIVLGKSGTGKSVLIKCIVELIHPDAGEIDVFGQKIPQLKPKELNEVRKKIGFLFQGAALYDSMSVRENLMFPLRRTLKQKNKKEAEEKIHKVLEDVGLSDAIDKMPSELSGGMRKRIGLARTLIPSPEIMLYDEPTTGLDPVTSNEISNLINSVRKEYQTSSIIITHDMPCARLTGDRIIMLRDGKVYAGGTYDELNNSDDEWIRAFFT